MARRRESPRSIYALIKADHRKVEALLRKLTAPSNGRSGVRREALLERIRKELLAHNRAEEAVFYSRLRESRESRILAIEGKSEHDIGADLMGVLSSLEGHTEEFAAKAKVLRELIEHHVEEEEGHVHKQARKELSDEEAEEIGHEFVTLKRQLLREPLPKGRLTHALRVASEKLRDVALPRSAA